MPKKKKLSVQEIGRKGGKTTLKKHGKGHYKKIAQARWDKEKSQQDEDEECEDCGGEGVVLVDAPVYPNEPHMAAIDEQPCACQGE